MTDQTDPLDALRHADPASSGRPPSDTKARVWARIEEVTMEDSNRSARSRSSRWGLALGSLGVAAAAGLAAFALLASPGSAPDPSDDPGTGIGSCVETYSAETLANRDFAFDGTVTAIDGDSVTFAVTESFIGDTAAGASVTLNAAGMTGTAITSAGGPNLEVGDRYLVAGDGEFVWACGFTQPYDASVAEEWASASR